MHAEGILVAKVLDLADEGHYYVAPIGSKRRRRVSGAITIGSSSCSNIDDPPPFSGETGKRWSWGARNCSSERQISKSTLKSEGDRIRIGKKEELMVSTAQATSAKVISL